MTELSDDRKHPDAKCEQCPLREIGRYVPSSGPESAKLAFVGEAPGLQEARGGKPFVGPSGKLLNIVLSHHNIAREEVFLSNATLCRPPDNAAPARSAILACRDRLLGELQDRGVETVVALGNSASESLLGQSGVTKLRVGPPKVHPDRPELKVIPTIHPAVCLRQGDQFPNLVTDIGKVNATHGNWTPPEYIVARTDDEAIDLMDAIDARLSEGTGLLDNPERILVVDIEVDIEKDTAFDHPNHYGMLCVGIGYDRRKVLVLSEGVMESEAVRDRLGKLLRTHRLVAQNGKFDLAGLFPITGGLELWFDTMLASYVFDERPGVHGLKFMAVEYLGAPQYDEEVKKYVGPRQGYGAIPRKLLYRYNAYDVACTYDMYRMWSERFAQDTSAGLRKVHDFLVAASNQLMYLELNGITVDREYLKTLDREYLARLHDIEDQLASICDRDYDKRGGINPRSPMQVKAYLADQGVKVDSTNADTLELVLKKTEGKEDFKDVHDFVSILLNHRREAKLHGTYVKGIAKRMYRGRVYPTFLLHGTTTGRLACRNPNMQNIPRESSIRRLFVPSDSERTFIQTDYSQAELRVLSYLAGDTYFRDIFNAGDVDVFDDLTPILYPEADRASMTPAEWKELRIRVKAYVYGVSYGRSEFSIASEFGISVAEARQGMERFFSVIPEIVDFRNQTRRAVLDGNDLVTPWGRHRRYALITKENRDAIMNEALAFLPQSTASDMCLQALTWTRQELKGIAWIRNIVHDSLLIECYREDVEEVTKAVERNMIESAKTIVGDYVKFAVESTVGDNWGAV